MSLTIHGTQTNTAEKNRLFPVFLKAENMHILLVGAGKIGLEKLTALLNNSPAAKVSIVADVVSEEVRNLAGENAFIELHQRRFLVDDLQGVDVVLVAVNNKETSRQIYEAAKAQRLLVNVADTPDLCDFYLGSIVQRGSLKLAISTNGKSPTMAKRIKEMLNQTLPEQLDEVIDNVHAFRKTLNGNFEDKVKQLNELTSVLVNDQQKKEGKWKKIASFCLIAFAFMLIGHFIFSYYISLKAIGDNALAWYYTLDKNIHWMFLAGFFAQLVDGALGMGYGVTSATVMLSAGVNPAVISGSIHTAEMFASGASGYSHYKFGNVNKKLLKALIIPGVLGAVAGAILLTTLGDSNAASKFIKPILAGYTMLLGIRILFTAFINKNKKTKKFKRYGLLAAAGGFLDSFGGGGWGPIVTTTLITKGRSPRFVIGTVSLTEFFVTLASAFTFFTILGISHWQTIVALILGGIIAAPIAAKLAGKLPRKTSLILLGILVIIWSLKILLKAF